jgi:7-keto-8-aminopelargonate synthetase-like enzyme
VPNKAARLRFFLNADHTEAVIDASLTATARVVGEAATLTF